MSPKYKYPITSRIAKKVDRNDLRELAVSHATREEVKAQKAMMQRLGLKADNVDQVLLRPLAIQRKELENALANVEALRVEGYDA